jgi:hypothetical protein
VFSRFYQILTYIYTMNDEETKVEGETPVEGAPTTEETPAAE